MCLKERDTYRAGRFYEHMETDQKVVSLLLSSKFNDFLLTERDDSYGNTPLHVACSLHCYPMIEMLLSTGKSRERTNLAGLTPEQVVLAEIEKYTAHVESAERTLTLERLSAVKTLFN